MGKLVTLNNNEKYLLKVNSDETVTLIVENNDVSIEYMVDNANLNLLIYIKEEDSVAIKESGYISNSNVTVKYVELNNHEFKQTTQIDVLDNSNLEISTIYLGINDKKIDFNLINSKPNTAVSIRNNIVCLDKANIIMNVIGTILKGAKAARCHQKNHCLTVDSPLKAEVLPVLKIDENDVEASHSLSSGTIDEEVMFYMNSRGLSKKEALNLMVLSYLMPTSEEFETFENGKELYELSKRRVEEVCSI